jgi:ADP-ribose pyrophosphatase
MLKQDISMKSIILSEDIAYKGFFKILRVRLQHELFSGDMSKPIVRELFVRGHSVAILMHDTVLRRVILVNQFRIGAINDESQWLVELPAGMIEVGEEAIDVAIRESIEETGIEPKQLSQICEFYNSAGGSSEKTTLYYAQVDSSHVAEFSGLATENEDIQVLVVDEDVFLDGVRNGKYATSSVLMAGFWLMSQPR